MSLLLALLAALAVTQGPCLAADASPTASAYLPLTLDALSAFPYVSPDFPSGNSSAARASMPDWREQVPKAILDLDGKKVEVQGFMIPLETTGGKLQSFVLVKSRLNCCFGVVPKTNEWVMVSVKKGVEAGQVVDVPLKVRGDLEVGEKSRDGQSLGLYRLRADWVEQPGWKMFQWLK